MFFRTKHILVMCLMLMFSALPAIGQLADLDLLEDNDRSVGVSINSTPDPDSGNPIENRSAILLVPLSLGEGEVEVEGEVKERPTFQGGAGLYWSQVLAQNELTSYLQWRIQGGPHYKKVGLQFYIEGFWKGNLDYAGFFRFGEFRFWRTLFSAGFGTLVETETSTDLSVGIERNAAAGGDTTVKGLLLLSGEVDTPIFESLRLLGIVKPTLEGDHDYVGEGQLSYRYGKISLAGFARLGYEDGTVTRRYTGLVKVPF